MNKFLLTLILILFFSISLFSALNESLTYDEIVYVEEGLNHLRHQTFDIDTFNPPLVREIAAMPLFLGLQNYLLSDLPNIKALPSRLVVTGFGILLIIFVYLTTKKYFNSTVALLAALMLSFEPNFLAHSHYVTLDIGFSLFFYLAYFYFINLIDNTSLKNTFIAGLTTGLAFAAKISAIPYLLFSILFTFSILYQEIKLRINLTKIFVYLIVLVLTVWSAYFLKTDVIIAKRDDQNRLSAKLVKYAESTENQFLKKLLLSAQQQKLPLGHYLATLKNTLLRSQEKSQVFFFGKIYSQNSWYFLPINIIFKTSLPLLLLFFYGSFILFKNHNHKLGLFIIPLISIVGFSSLSNLQPWIRYILPIYPFLAVVGAYGLNQLIQKKSYKIALLSVLWLTISTFNTYPHFITYANELILGLGKRYEFFSDSNLDWGQSLIGFRHYLKKNPQISVSFYYFGRDNGNYYVLTSNHAYGSYKLNEICAFHEIKSELDSKLHITAISVSNWYDCGFYQVEQFKKAKIKEVIANTILVFY